MNTREILQKIIFVSREKWGESKNKKVGEGKEGNACRQALWISNIPFASERSSWLAGLVDHYWHVSIKGLNVLSAGKNVEACLQKALIFSRNEYLVVNFDSTVEIL